MPIRSSALSEGATIGGWRDLLDKLTGFEPDDESIKVLYHDNIDNSMNNSLGRYFDEAVNSMDGVRGAHAKFPKHYGGSGHVKQKIRKELGGDPDVIINFMAGPPSGILREFEDNGTLVLNDPDMYPVTGSKVRTQQLLEQANVPVAETVIPHSYDDIREFCDRVEGPYVLKPSNGFGGKGVRKVDTAEEALKQVNLGTDIVQEDVFKYWPHQSYRDIRAYVVGDQCIGAMYRVNDDWITNIHNGGHGEKVPDDAYQKVAELAVDAVKAMGDGLHFSGVDILERYDKDGNVEYVVLELNSAPGGFYNLERSTGHGRDAVRQIVEYSVELEKELHREG